MAEEPRNEKLEALVRGFLPECTADMSSTGEKGMINDVVVLEADELVVKVAGGGDPTPDEIDRIAFEAEDLDRLRAFVPTPEVVKRDRGLLALRFVPHGRVNWKALEKCLARLHEASAEEHARGPNSAMFGLERDSFYGEERLVNGWWDDWWAFFFSTRWDPVVQRLREKVDTTVIVRVSELIKANIALFGAPEKPVLLHGDTWANNILCGGPDGLSVTLVDPVCFWGDPLLDFAKFSNKRSSQPRSLLYQLYFAMHYTDYTGDMSRCDDPVRRVLRSLCTMSARARPSVDCRPNLEAMLRFSPEDDLASQQRAQLSPLMSTAAGGASDDGLTIVLLVGAFNPPHPNHRWILARSAQELRSLGHQRVMCLASASHQHYIQNKHDITPDKRLDLETREKLWLQSDPSPVITYPGTHASLVALLRAAMQSQPGDNRVWLACGSDCLGKCVRAQVVPRDVPLVCVRRSHHDIDEGELQRLREEHGAEIVYVADHEPEVWSSTRVRDDDELWRRMTA